MVLCLGSWAAPPPAPADTLTLGVRAGAGYDDNVRLRQEPQSDFFEELTPYADMEWGPPEDNLQLRGSITYEHYHRLTQYTGINSADLLGRYHHGFSPVTTLDLLEYFNTSYDPVEKNLAGGLVQVTDQTTRRTSNTVGSYMRHEYGPQSDVHGGYTMTYTTYDTEPSNDAYYHMVELGVTHAFNADYVAGLTARGVHNDYERNPSTNRGTLEGRLGRWIGPTLQLYTLGAATASRSDDDDTTPQGGQDYEIYTVQLGASHEVSPVLAWDLAAGASYVSGDSSTNSAAGKWQPTGQATITWSGQRWSLAGRGRVAYQEYDAVGQSTGLVLTEQLGVTFTRQLAQKWDLVLLADYIRDQYQQDQQVAGETGRDEINTYRAGAILTWRFARDFRFSLDYRYLERDEDLDQNDRTQNRVILYLYADWPNRW
ncbi:MAG: outer membrane beta-barrel protein [Deltaproteobacteria bacterium]|nr:outer membrane beta-barrel protein [Deltaproteobacteria bacterium]